MGTYAELKARVAAELTRTDQTTNIVKAISRAIEHYAGRRFWFNTTPASATLAAGEFYLAAPRYLDTLYLTSGGQPWELQRITINDMEGYLTLTTNPQRPYLYAVYGKRIRVYPTADVDYTFRSYGIFDLAPLGADDSSNAWTTEAEDLIASRAKYTISRDIIGNADRAAAAQLAEREALSALLGETAKRIGTGRLQPAC